MLAHRDHTADPVGTYLNLDPSSTEALRAGVERECFPWIASNTSVWSIRNGHKPTE